MKKLLLPIVGLLILAGLFGWWLGRASDDNKQPVSTQQEQPVSSTSTASDVNGLVTYALPNQWQAQECSNATYIIPNGINDPTCGNSENLPITISVDASNSTDCNQLQNVQNVSKHICISEFINGKKTLKAETVYTAQSSYKKETTINAYYINTGKGVVKLAYVHSPADNEYQVDFEVLAKSVQAK